jgi:hypothetical protein
MLAVEVGRMTVFRSVFVVSLVGALGYAYG